jgi:hypothetical protein
MTSRNYADARIEPPMIARRTLLIGASATLLCAPAIVRAASLMPVRGIIALMQQNYYGFVYRLWIDSLYRSGKLQGAALTHAIEHGLLDHISETELRRDN